MALSSPEPLAAHHEVEDFTSGETSLDDWLKRRASANQASGASRTYVVCEESKVIGYYALAWGALTVERSGQIQTEYAGSDSGCRVRTTRC